MQREIKFRAWVDSNKEMVSPYFFVNDENFITQYGSSKPSAVMQFTGSKDKNGVEIYEGDIAKCQPRGIKDLGIFTVKYDHVYGSYVLIFNKWCGLNVSSPENYPLGEGRFDIEVIGNIYENLDLINS